MHMNNRNRKTLPVVPIAVAFATVALLGAKLVLGAPFQFFPLIWSGVISIMNLIWYQIDKSNSQVRMRPRAKEAHLYFVAFLGGGPGGLAGMFLFRHKTLKNMFWLVNAITTTLWIVLIVWAFFQ